MLKLFLKLFLVIIFLSLMNGCTPLIGYGIYKYKHKKSIDILTMAKSEHFQKTETLK